ncbi:MAG: hypothetical protein M3N68_13310 [Actinomycetota bacterium]|nr:hypothetical protein [Actinomycetota bacterium]
MSTRPETIPRPRLDGAVGRPARLPGRRDPGLRLVARPERAAWTRRRKARLITVLVVIAVGVGLFALVASHVVLTQGQFRLDRLQARAAAEQARYERLRLQVAELEAPERVVAAAQERLGMVPPPGVTYLSPTGPVPGTSQGRQGLGESAATDDWSRVKRQLSSRP